MYEIEETIMNNKKKSKTKKSVMKECQSENYGTIEVRATKAHFFKQEIKKCLNKIGIFLLLFICLSY